MTFFFHTMPPPTKDDGEANVHLDHYRFFSQYGDFGSQKRKFKINWSDTSEAMEVVQLFGCQKNQHEFLYEAGSSYNYETNGLKLLAKTFAGGVHPFTFRDDITPDLNMDMYLEYLRDDVDAEKCPGLLSSWRKLFGTWSQGRIENTYISKLRCLTNSCENTTITDEITSKGAIGYSSMTGVDLTLDASMNTKGYMNLRIYTAQSKILFNDPFSEICLFWNNFHHKYKHHNRSTRCLRQRYIRCSTRHILLKSDKPSNVRADR